MSWHNSAVDGAHEDLRRGTRLRRRFRLITHGPVGISESSASSKSTSLPKEYLRKVNKGLQVSISRTFYKRLFHTKVLLVAFLWSPVSKQLLLLAFTIRTARSKILCIQTISNKQNKAGWRENYARTEQIDEKNSFSKPRIWF